MKLEELIKEQETKNHDELNQALEIAEREWEKVRVSLELCGDIGEFNKKDFMVGIIDEDVIVRQPLRSPTKSVSGYSPTFYPMYFLKNILLMDEKYEDFGYNTLEAMYMYIELATKAISRLGLNGNLAMGFGAGYAYSRTGWISEKGLTVERDIFYKMFFKNRTVEYKWDFFWTSVKESMLEIFNKFEEWEKDPEIYSKETKPKAKVIPMMV